MAISQLFAPFAGSTVNLSAGTSSARVAKATLPAGSSASHELRIVNSGTIIVFVEFGDSTVAATTTTGLPILPNTVESFMLNASQTHIAAITAASTAVIYFTTGLGA
jgi:hypothetical protein